ncbi:HEAT repeat domain-containing protein [Schlesneria paludicola]|uniref:HEAT repeat domain-containing protein n=1 Tax=Schlesneria paludicola TaxID=360056 RepID=UPI00029A3671|nr:HEAT repeat domain-containing protein [Schlesneria paludicola]
MVKKTPLQVALEQGLAEGGNLFESLNELEHYEIESVEDAEALVDAMESYVQLPVEPPGTHAPFHQLVSLFQAVTSVTPFQYLVRRGIPLLIQAYDARLPQSEDQQNELLFAIKIFARYGLEEGFDRLVQAAYHPILREGYLWSVIFEQLGDLDPAVPDLIERLSDPLPDGFASIAFLDWVNRLAREELITGHPFDSHDGTQKLRYWLRSSDKDEFSFAHSAAGALPFISEPQRVQLLALAMDHPDSAVQMEAAWASAHLGSEAGLKFLVRLCLDRNFSTTACAYLEELGREDVIPDAANEPDFRAIADLCDWLSDPQEFGRPPDEIELYDTREIFWPPTNDVRQLWLFRYRFVADEAGESDECGLGMCGSITYSLFNETNFDMAAEDVYALHCCWELEMNSDSRAPEERTIAAGRAILEAGARGEYSNSDDDDDDF